MKFNWHDLTLPPSILEYTNFNNIVLSFTIKGVGTFSSVVLELQTDIKSNHYRVPFHILTFNYYKFDSMFTN